MSTIQRLPKDGLEVIFEEIGRAYWRQYPIIVRRYRKILRKYVNIHGAVTEMRTEHLPSTSYAYCFLPTHQYDLCRHCQVIFIQEFIRTAVPMYFNVLMSNEMQNPYN